MYGGKEEREYFSKVLRELFKKENISQKEFAERADVSYHKLYKWFHGETFPSGEDFHKLATYFGYTFNEFL